MSVRNIENILSDLEEETERHRLSAESLRNELSDLMLPPAWSGFRYGDRVRKRTGASWQGRVVGWYSASRTPRGVAVESEREPGSVQIYPEVALEFVPWSEPCPGRQPERTFP